MSSWHNVVTPLCLMVPGGVVEPHVGDFLERVSQSSGATFSGKEGALL